MLENLVMILTQKGVLIGGMTGLTKGVYQLRRLDFSLLIFTTELFMSCVIGYVAWELVGDSTTVPQWTKIIFTIFSSANAVLVVSIFFNKSLAKAIFLGFISQAVKNESIKDIKLDEYNRKNTKEKQHNKGEVEVAEGNVNK